MGTRWRGLLAPLGVSTGDGRRFKAEGVTHRELPLPLKWQRNDEMGHDTSVIIGSLETINIASVGDAIDQGWISTDATAGMDSETMGAWGGGELFDDADPARLPRLAEDVQEALLLTQKSVIGPSVDAGAASAIMVAEGSDEPLTDEEFEALWWQAEADGEEIAIEVLFTEYEIAAATLVSIPAFAQCRPFELVDAPDMAITAAVRSTGWDSMPLADRDTTWDGAAAAGRLTVHCTDGDTLDMACYAAGFLYQDGEGDPENKGTYGFGIVDIIDGELQIVPKAVFAVAGVLEGGRGGTTIPDADQEAMRGVVETLYERMAREFDDDTITVPWDAAVRKRKNCSAEERYASLTAAAPLPPAEWFDQPRLDTVTPITITDDGRVYGHIATHDVCHLGHRDVCMTAPVDPTGTHPAFNRYPLETDDHGHVMVGRLTIGHGKYRNRCGCCRGNDDHACNNLTAAGTMAHHDQLTTVAWVRAYEDQANDAIVVTGMIDAAATVDDLQVLSRRRVSGDWRDTGNGLALVEVLVLSREKPGFPLPRARQVSGRMASLTAACPVAPAARSTAAVDVDVERLAEQVADRVVARLAATIPTTDAPAAAVEPTVEPDATSGAPVPQEMAEVLADLYTVLSVPVVADLERLVGPLSTTAREVNA
jgi:hypothetical protein